MTPGRREPSFANWPQVANLRSAAFQRRSISPLNWRHPVTPSFVTTLAFLVLLSLQASAQPAQIEKNISMRMALMIIDGVLEQCTKDGYKVSVVVVNKAGMVAASVGGDGTN